jgi:sporulation protein YlmC with PRC-barrel domain
MSATDASSRLLRLSDTDQTIADPAVDVRGRTALDRNDEEIGTVDDLFIDEDEKKVRFLRIGSGGFLGIGKEHFLVPVDAVEAVQPDAVRINQERARMTDVPGYDPDVTYDDTYYQGVYGWWGYGAYWAPGYVYPAYPYF